MAELAGSPRLEFPELMDDLPPVPLAVVLDDRLDVWEAASQSCVLQVGVRLCRMRVYALVYICVCVHVSRRAWVSGKRNLRACMCVCVCTCMCTAASV